MPLPRRLLAILGTAFVWAVAWLPFAIAFALYRASQLNGGDGHLVRVVLFVAGIFVLWGGVSGAIYAVILTLTERRQSLLTLSGARVAGWGALGSMTLPAILMFLIVGSSGFYEGWLQQVATVLLVSGMLGAGCAAGTLILARRGALDTSP